MVDHEEITQLIGELNLARHAMKHATRLASLDNYRMDDVLPGLLALIDGMDTEQCDLGYVPGYAELLTAAREQAEFGAFNFAAKTLRLAYELKMLVAP